VLKVIPPEVIPPGGQASIAKLLKLTSKAAHIKKHWEKLKNCLIDITFKNDYKKLCHESDDRMVRK
jgi:hypothetical protein